MGRERSPDRAALTMRGGEPDGLGSLTHEVGGLVDAAFALVPRDLWVRAQGARAIHDVVGAMRGQNLIWRLPLLDPTLDDRDHVEVAGTFAATAVAHAGRHEEPVAVAQMRGAEFFLDATVV